MKNRERKLKAIIIILVITILILCIQLFLVKKGSINSKKQIIKEMSESEQVTDLNNQINELNTSHTEYMNYIQTCKAQIATALTNEGVTTSNQVALETMASNISQVLQARTNDATATADNITEGKTAYVNGEKIIGTGADNNFYYNEGKNSANINRVLVGTYDGWNAQCYGGTYDCTSIEGYKNLTIDNFAYVITKVEYRMLSYNSSYNSYGTSMSYDATTGKLTVRLCLNISGGDSQYLNINPSANIYCYY